MKLKGDAREIYKKIVNYLKTEAKVKEAEEELKKFDLVSDRGEILKRQKLVRELMEKARKISFEELTKLSYFEFKKRFFEDRCYVAKDEEEYEEALKIGVCEVRFSPAPFTLLLNHDIEAEPKIEHLAPEIFVVPLLQNLHSLKLLSEIEKRVEGKEEVAKILEEVERIKEMYERVREVEELETAVHEILIQLNEKIEERLENVKIILSGKEILSLAEKAFEKIRDVIEEEVKAAEEKIYEKFGIYENVFTISYPIEVNEEKLREFKKKLEERHAIDFYLACRRIVERYDLKSLNEKIRRYRSLALYKVLQDFAFPEIGEELRIFRGRNLFIDNPQPIDYYLDERNRIAILTGANSGGKTSLLELVCQIVILAHMGLPVNAERAEIRVFDELFFFKRKKMSYGSGAFENTIKAFARAISSKGRKLILVDEFEAITEPGAAVKILKKILELIHSAGDYAIVVSHLGEELSKLDFVRVDGIEAVGLDENFRLIVNRQPVFGKIGKSTPELIVEKLRRTSKGREKEVYEKIAEAFYDIRR